MNGFTVGQQSTARHSTEGGNSSMYELYANEAVRIPDNLLSGYPMQWALNQIVKIINLDQTIHVCPYKLATQSEAFRRLVQLNSESGGYAVNETRRNPIENDWHAAKQTGQMTKSKLVVPLPLLVYCDPKSSTIADLLFAIHFCHIGNCEISGITTVNSNKLLKTADAGYYQSATGHSKMEIDITEKMSPDEFIYETKEVLLRTHIVNCSLECGIRVACTYEIPTLQHVCYKYAQSVISPANCWQLWRIATRSMVHDSKESPVTYFPEFTQMVRQYIHANFNRLVQQPDSIDSQVMNTECIRFEELAQNELEFLLSSDRLNVNQEDQVVQAIRRWLDAPNYRVGEPRMAVAQQLLQKCVRIDQLRLEDIEALFRFVTRSKGNKRKQTDKQIKNNAEAKKMTTVRTECLSRIRRVRRQLYRTSRNLRPLVETKNCQKTELLSLSGRKPEAKGDTELIAEARLPHEAIFIFGGWKMGGPCRDVSVFDSRKGKWLTYGTDGSGTVTSSVSSSHRILLPYALMSFGIALVQNRYIFIAGGEEVNKRTTSRVICYDLYTNGIESMRTKVNGNSDIDWKSFPPLHEGRRDLALVNLDDHRIYAIGGDNNRTVLNTVEYFSVNDGFWNERRGWIEAAGMLIARGGPAADCLNNIIYVCGGYTESQMEALTNSCEAFSPITNQWTFIRPMAQPRYYAQAVTVEGVLFVLGGGGESGTEGAMHITASVGYSSTVERYDPQTEMWELMPPTSERADFAACLFEDHIICLGGGGESFCTDEVERWKPWLPTDRPARTNRPCSHLNLERLTERPVTDESFGPIWLSSNSRTNESNVGWNKYVRLPFPVWGHRCVVPKNCDLILPYLNRPASQALNQNCRIEYYPVAGQCLTINNQHILVTCGIWEDNSKVYTEIMRCMARKTTEVSYIMNQ
ncbi:hypothetical protein EG68_09811 [Paragonimus skrjabini miyazakii]|uniref:BACK domain-containing protein n=1 Tax=Paragonimus skrjabini miyazakii TaxID=59628 RepID=A0A8S9YTX5_9TREM|nr:hypothetical protein EG68_09811 [Paragonimus skrjabini miyazakii]